MLEKMNEFEELILGQDNVVPKKDVKVTRDQFDNNYPFYCFVKHVVNVNPLDKVKVKKTFGPYWIIKKTKGRLFVERIKFSKNQLPVHTNEVDVFELKNVEKKVRIGVVGIQYSNFPIMEVI